MTTAGLLPPSAVGDRSGPVVFVFKLLLLLLLLLLPLPPKKSCCCTRLVATLVDPSPYKKKIITLNYKTYFKMSETRNKL
jgi:hypothetical protein